VAVGRRRIAGVLCVLLLAGSLAACGAPRGSATGTLTLYSGQHLQTSLALVQAFEAQTGITVKVRSADEATLASQLMIEGSRSPADVFLSGNSPALEAVAAKGLLAPLPTSTLDQVPASDSSPTGRWVGTSARVAMLAYSTSQLTPGQLPRTILGLADPKWKGRLGIAPTDTDFGVVVTSVAHTYGQAAALRWLEALKANAGGHVYPDNEALMAAINRGAVALGVLNQYYWYRMAAVVGARSMGSALATFDDGDAGYVLAISGAGVLAASKNQRQAQEFVAFVVSPKGQSIIAHSGSFEYPIARGASTPAGEPAFSTLHPAPISIAALGTGAGALALLREAQLL
jgi:iron(III) transport system substrate-binding protein